MGDSSMARAGDHITRPEAGGEFLTTYLVKLMMPVCPRTWRCLKIQRQRLTP